MENYTQFSNNLFKQNGYLVIKDFVSADLCKFLTHVLLRQHIVGALKGDSQVPNCLAIMDHEVLFETLQEKIWPMMEHATGLELLPTYSYARLYTNGNTLEKHSDRPECEVSISLQLGRSHHYSWPIFMAGNRVDLGEGQGVIYRGCDLEHWRNPCDGPPGYYSGQVFMHYVNAKGPYADRACDPTNRTPHPHMFVKQRDLVMETK
jgi:hypothetical protein